MEFQTCKKHGKPRDRVYQKKMPNGGVFTLAGCADCATSAPRKADKKAAATAKKPATRAGGLRKF